ncbi:MAG: dephospho-CoA kinase [Deltaproteobacteria bacterium]|nr:dephospho-CoA kinase [Deltaproteobacteria bacterium]
MKAIGLTGGIGSGKTTVAAMLEEFGATVIHADAVGHETYRPHSDGWHRLIATFGAAILAPDETIDRKRLGAVVFSDPQALARLNAIVHPLIFAEIQRRIAAYRAAGHVRPIVVEAAVLIEANWLPLVDEVWLVLTNRDAVIERLEKQRGLRPAAVDARIAAQLRDAERERYADVIIHNTGTLADLRREVRTLWDRVLSRG